MFGILIIHKPSLSPIGSAVLTFIGYKRTDRQMDKQKRFQSYIIKSMLKNMFSVLKGTFSVISSDPPCKDATA